MSAPGNLGNSNVESADSADYFSRRVSRHHPWTADLVTIDSYEEEPQDGSDERARRSAPLSPVQSDLLTPATLSPPVESTETSPLLDTNSYGTSYASTSTPIVCCRPGGRPADIPQPPTTNNNNNAHIFPNGPPQDMGDQPLWYRSYALREFERNKPFPSRRPAQRRGFCGSKYLHRWLLALGFLAILFLVQCLIQSAMHTEPSTHDWDPFDRSLPYWSKTFTHSFDKVESFSLVDEMRARFPIDGMVKIEPAQSGQEADIIATMAYGSSTEFHVSSPNWELTDSSMRLLLPTFSETPDFATPHYGPQLRVAVTLYLKAAISWASFKIDTTHLAIKSSNQLFSSDSTLSPTINTTSFTTHSTPIHLPHWTSRHTILKTSSSPITGSFTLLDLLVLTSSSGYIHVGIDSGEADSSNPQPAKLSISTSSGAVKVDSSLLAVHDREYKTDVSTQSGSITGTFLLGASARLETSSASINAEFTPFDSQASSSKLETRSSSGFTRVEVLSAYKNGGKAFKGLRSEHVSAGSGAIQVRYPGEWEGKIDAAVASGSISVRGEGVVVDEAGQYGGGHVRAHKGEGESRIEARAGSGSVGVSIGDS